jgi:hypothetical protein
MTDIIIKGPNYKQFVDHNSLQEFAYFVKKVNERTEFQYRIKR